METEEEPLDPQDVARAKAFWAEENVDQVFVTVFGYLDHLRSVLKTNMATDKERVQGLKLLDCLDWWILAPPTGSQVVKVVIGADDALPADLPHPSPPCPASPSPTPHPPADSQELLPPLEPVPLQYLLHACCKTCLPTLPSMHQSLPPFWAENPLKVPLLCGFKRLSATPQVSQAGGGAVLGGSDGEEEEAGDSDIVYKSPCGQTLRNHDDVVRFLVVTESYDVLQVDFFSFNPAVQVDPPMAAGPQHPELDLSRGLEPTPVELCAAPGDLLPADFRYRKERWPHGCFLSRGSTLFNVCCDCTDGCSDAQRCACIAMTRGGRHYTHQRLTEPIASGVYECGPWCGCDRSRCQNRLVQRGIRVRLQVFQTDHCGWGVRCRDDLDAGTFICIFAGVVLQRVQGPAEPPPPKLTRADLPSDDEVEIVTEWLAPPVLEGRGSLLEIPLPKSPPTSPPLHVPVIQRPAEAPHRDKVLAGRSDSPSADDPSPALVSMATGSGTELNGTETENRRSLKRMMNVEDVYMLDARKEGNVSRFLNHSCQPNLFLQNVFTDSHDLDFPVIAFFTSRTVKAGTELTWNYSHNTCGAKLRKQEVPCLCGSDGCRGRLTIEENLRGMCEAES
ncbi:histone-lysine N-methyltransferase SETDB2 isoform 2-T6 [Aulostomus maculatus]